MFKSVCDGCFSYPVLTNNYGPVAIKPEIIHAPEYLVIPQPQADKTKIFIPHVIFTLKDF